MVGALYIAEGPETAATIASLDRQATVLVSLALVTSLIWQLLSKGMPQKLFIAADNDGDGSAACKITVKACQCYVITGLMPA
ncbi:MAG: toprim domain-containing protein [Tatlockia sp.]|nr:toprim domain-containing protein [Tatlockia sp.]